MIIVCNFRFSYHSTTICKLYHWKNRFFIVESFSYSLKYNNKSYSGTGDIFTSIISGLITNGYDFKESIKIASDFIFKCISYTGKYDTDPNDGVFFEIFLNDLTSLNN